MKNKFLLLAAALVLSTTATFATNNTVETTDNGVSAVAPKSEDMIVLIRQYMSAHDICCTYICQQQGTTNYLVKDTYGLSYIVYVSDGVIIGHDEVDL
jgi:hypothetical protein